MAICIYSTVTINQLITNTVAANSKFKTEIAKAQFLKKYEFWGPCNIKSMVRIMVKSLCVVGLVLENWYLICGQISCLHIAIHFHTLTFYRNGVIFEAGWHPPGDDELIRQRTNALEWNGRGGRGSKERRGSAKKRGPKGCQQQQQQRARTITQTMFGG